MKKEVKTFIIYQYLKTNNDLQYIKEVQTTKEIEKLFNLKNARQYITKDIDNIKHLINDKYIIFQDILEEV